MSLPKVVITDFISEPLDFERNILGEDAEVVSLGAMGEDALVGEIETAAAIICYHYLSITRDTISRMQDCKAIVRGGVGYDNIDHRYARQRGIPVCNVPDYGTEEVADSTLGMMLSLARGTHFLHSRLRRGAGAWSVEQAKPIPRLRGRILGIIGCGRIGSAVALRAKSFGLRVVFYDPYVPDGLDKALGIQQVNHLGELLAQSHLLTLHCPLTSETSNIIGATELAALPPGAFLVNTARGGVVDTEAVIDALASGHLHGAGIDVLENEPPRENSKVLKAWRDPDHPAHDRLLLNPHAAFYCEEGGEEFRTKAACECLRAIRGEALRNVVN
ncbi:MAG: 2-hydroxyacid dehydrogenase [Verrucomicrobiaceae bacterium]|nr:2-hydroxyacid dehydrogenase [Verrucomicrobiaceae bacterium]